MTDLNLFFLISLPNYVLELTEPFIKNCLFFLHNTNEKTKQASIFDIRIGVLLEKSDKKRICCCIYRLYFKKNSIFINVESRYYIF